MTGVLRFGRGIGYYPKDIVISHNLQNICIFLFYIVFILNPNYI